MTIVQIVPFVNFLISQIQMPDISHTASDGLQYSSPKPLTTMVASSGIIYIYEWAMKRGFHTTLQTAPLTVVKFENPAVTHTCPSGSHGNPQ